MKKILVVGATSAIAEACCRLWAARGDTLLLAARDQLRLEIIAADLRIRGAAHVEIAAFDALAYDGHAALIAQAESQLGGLDIVFAAHGSLPDQPACQTDAALALREIGVNGLSIVSLAGAAAERFAANGQGTIAVIGSVAGDRGRQSNYVYGAAKGMVSVFLSGLRHRLYPRGVQVVEIRPGFVDTPMTAAFPKGPLWATPAGIAPKIVAAIDRGKAVIYVPGFWALIMLIVRLLPLPLFLRSKL